ncbi:cytochrome P450 76A2-like isoform X2 [Monomorium pharaonis]|uniref:cytochrome P450 76A2-like isoform X2 n=2 Tax=Monomorium pharaonis TaxID=307658 RepID=UPI001747CECD|nr:cytochrome P450 76A2-like isoform X2 [Monomorium pharaonis]
MPYTEAIMTESQRIRNVGPILPPHRTVEDTILDGYKIPKDTMVLLNAESNNMDPELYPDPISFRPERKEKMSWRNYGKISNISHICRDNAEILFTSGTR